jgi:prepilin-type N-terminal cleavage/methylation domain-containing protein
MKQRERGVTLIEIAVVLAIVGIMALFMAPAIGEWIDNYRIRQAAREISSTLQQAKMQTISTKTTNSVDFNTTNNTYTLQPEGKVAHVPRGVNIASVTAATVSFSPDGTSTSITNEIITIDNAKGKQYQVSINAVGRVSIQEI